MAVSCAKQMRSAKLRTHAALCDVVDINEQNMAAMKIDTRFARMGLCKICKEKKARYRCPRCSLTSCSLECVKRHKADQGCDGVRDKTAFVSVKDFSDLHLLSDYRFLEEMARSLDNASRIDIDKRPQNRLTYWQHKLVVECQQRKINLKILPNNFSRHKANSTVFIRNQRKILWTVEWVYPQANRLYTDIRVPGDQSLSTLLEKYLNPELSTEEIGQQLIFYQAAGYNDIALVMRLLDRPSNEKVFVELNISKSLEQNLRNKVIIEYPTIEVILKNHRQMYNISDAVGEPDESDSGEDDVEDLPIRHSVESNDVDFSTCPISDLSDDDIPFDVNKKE